MLKLCCRGMAAACLTAGLCLPAPAQEAATAPAHAFTPPEHMMHQVLASYFGITHQQVMDLAARGYTYEQIATAANLAARSGRPLADIVAMHDRHIEFSEIAAQVGVSPDDMDRPVAPSPMTRVAAERATMEGGGAAGGHSSYAMPVTKIDWSRRYELTPLEMKRLRAKGLRDSEIYVIANASEQTGISVDDLAQRVFRGETTPQMAAEFGIPQSQLEEVKPIWKTPEWEAAVREGLWYVPGPNYRPGEQGGMAPTPRTRPGRGRRGRMGGEGTEGAGSSASPDNTSGGRRGRNRNRNRGGGGGAGTSGGGGGTGGGGASPDLTR